MDHPRFTRGDTFSELFQRRRRGAPVPIEAGWDAVAQLRHVPTPSEAAAGQKGAVIETFVCTVLDQVAHPGKLLLVAESTQTALWPIGTHVFDIRFVKARPGLPPLVSSLPVISLVVQAEVSDV